MCFYTRRGNNRRRERVAEEKPSRDGKACETSRWHGDPATQKRDRSIRTGEPAFMLHTTPGEQTQSTNRRREAFWSFFSFETPARIISYLTRPSAFICFGRIPSSTQNEIQSHLRSEHETPGISGSLLIKLLRVKQNKIQTKEIEETNARHNSKQESTTSPSPSPSTTTTTTTTATSVLRILRTIQYYMHAHTHTHTRTHRQDGL